MQDQDPTNKVLLEEDFILEVRSDEKVSNYIFSESTVKQLFEIATCQFSSGSSADENVLIQKTVFEIFDDFSLNEWVRYKDLVGDEDVDAVKKMAIIIKMATLMNITNSNAIKDVACDVLGDTVILKTEVEKDATLEISQAMTIAGDFKKVFGKNLQIL